jgi:hypothetical protein
MFDSDREGLRGLSSGLDRRASFGWTGYSLLHWATGLLWLKGMRSSGECEAPGFLRQAQDRLFDCDVQKARVSAQDDGLGRGQSWKGAMGTALVDDIYG